MKRQTYESLVSWCSFSTWIPRLTDEVPGFVAGVAAQALFQNLIPFSVRKKDFDVNPGLTSPCFPHVFAHSSVVPFYLSLTSDQKLRWEISKRAKKKRGGKRRGLSQWETSLVVSHSIQDILSWWAENWKPRKKPSSSNLQLSTLW